MIGMQAVTRYSFWEKEAFLQEVDYLIIGAGLVGLNAALELRQLNPHATISILDQGSLPIGASTRNAGFACFGSPTELLADLQTHDASTVWSMAQQRWEGLQLLRSIVGDDNMGYRHFGGYEIFRPTEVSTFQACQEKLAYLNQAFERITGISSTFTIATEKFGFQQVAHIIKSKIEGQLHPGKMMRQLRQIVQTRGIQLLTGIPVKTVAAQSNRVEIHTPQHTFKAQQLLLATNGFTQRLFPNLAVQPARNQVLITKPIPNLPFKGCFHYDRGYYYFRNVGNRVLLGGGRHLAQTAETTAEFGTTPLIQNALRNLLQTVILPHHPFEIDQWWSGILGVGEQKQPIVQRMNDRVTVAVRLGGMGVAIGALVGQSAARIAAG